jgi:hypothetical protein
VALARVEEVRGDVTVLVLDNWLGADDGCPAGRGVSVGLWDWIWYSLFCVEEKVE